MQIMIVGNTYNFEVSQPTSSYPMSFCVSRHFQIISEKTKTVDGFTTLEVILRVTSPGKASIFTSSTFLNDHKYYNCRFEETEFLYIMRSRPEHFFIIKVIIIVLQAK